MAFKFKPGAAYSKTLRLLTIRQPWAWATVHAGRDVESRPWRTAYRGIVHIVAHHRMKPEDYAAFADFTRGLLDPAGIPAPHELLLGGIIGRATLIGCTGKNLSKWFTGPYGMYFANPEPLPFRKCKGSRSLSVSALFPDLSRN